MSTQLDQIVLDVKYRLHEYMEAQGIDFRSPTSFRCPNKANHKNGDKVASGSYREDRGDGFPGWKCNKCQISGDTFELANFMHNYPTDGPEFIHTTLAHICEVLNIDLDEALSEEDAEIDQYTSWTISTRKYLKEHKAPLEALTGPEFDREYSKELSEAILDKFNVALCDFDYNPEDPDRNRILSPARKGTLLIPVIHRGSVVAVVGRSKKGVIPKYRNTTKDKEHGVVYPDIINLDAGLRAAKKDGVLYIFEGVFNTLAAVASGMENSIGLLGTGHIDIEGYVASEDIMEVVICMDQDDAGRDSTTKLARRLSSAYIPVSIYNYEQDSSGKDYDVMFSDDMQETVEKITHSSNRVDLIEFMCIHKMDYLSDPHVSDNSKYERLLKDISKYGSMVLCMKYARRVSELFYNDEKGLTEIESRIRQVMQDAASPVMNRIDSMTEETLGKVKDSHTIEDKISAINSLSEYSVNVSKDSSASIKSTAKRELSDLLSSDDGGEGMIFKSGFSSMDDGIPDLRIDPILISDSNMICLAGSPSHGKSAVGRQMMMNYAFNHKDDVIVVYFSIDDVKKINMSWLRASLSGVRLSEIRRNYAGVKDQLREGDEKLRSIYGESFIMYDKGDCPTFDEITSRMKSVISQYPNKWPIFMVDSIFDANEVAENENKRAMIDRCLNAEHEITAKYNATVFNTVHVKKNIAGRPRVSDVKESGYIEYRSTIILSTFYSMKAYGENSLMYLEGPDGNRIPIIEVQALKAKMDSPMTTYYFAFEPATGKMRPLISPTEVESAAASRRSDISTNDYAASKGRTATRKEESETDMKLKQLQQQQGGGNLF